MKRSSKLKILKIPLLAAMTFALTMQVHSQNVSVNNTEISTSNDNGTNVIILEDNSTENTQVDNKKTEDKSTKEQTIQLETFTPEELEGGNWVLTGVETKSYNLMNITKWNTNETGIKAICSWKDKIEIIHTVESGFKWQDPPKNMQPGAYLNLEAVYTNIDYSTTANINTGIKMFFGRAGSDFKNPESNAIEVLKLNKDNKQYANEVKKGFYYAPNMLFDATNMCQFIVDCYVGKDHYVTTYTYTYQK